MSVKQIAFEVAKVAQQQGFAKKREDNELLANIEAHYWMPEYRDYVLKVRNETK